MHALIASQKSMSSVTSGKALDKPVPGRLIVDMETEAALRETMVEIGRRMYERNLVAGTNGNMSCRLQDGCFLITPSGKPKGRLDPNDLVIIDERGTLVSGNARPSSELKLHMFIYSVRSDVGAILHAHPIYCTAYASAGIPLDASISPEILLSVGEIPLAEYGTPSTNDLPRSVDKLALEHDAILLSNHGVVVAGVDLDDAYNKLETVEHFATIFHVAEAIGGARRLTNEQIARLVEIRNRVGLNADESR